MSSSQSLPETLPAFWRIIRRFGPHLRKQRRVISVSFLALLAEIGLRLLEPWPLKLVFDSVIPGGKTTAGSDLPFAALDPSLLLVVCAVGTVLITALRAVAAYGNTVGFATAGNKVLSQIRGELYSHLQRLSLSFHTKERSGDLVVRVISDVGQIKDVVVGALLPMLADALILVGMFALMFLLNWQLTLLALTTVPLFWVFTARVTGRIQQVARQQRKREGAMAATAAESIGAIKIVQALSLEHTLGGAFVSKNGESLKQDVKAAKLSASLERTVDVLIAVATGLVLWYGATLVMRSVLSAGDLLVFLTYLKNAFKPVRDFAKYTGRIAKATAAGERVLDVLEREPDVRDLPDALPAPALQGAVRFERVNFAYEPGHPILRDIELSVRQGEHVALVGPSGHGKSTLLGLLLRLYDPTAGRVLIDGRDIRDYTIDSLRSQVSVVMQDTILFAATVRDNIAYGVAGSTDEEIEAAARLANAHNFIMALPDGYDTIVGERGATLSNGQRQRIAIARAAIRKAPIVILDEPTTSLDEENERLVMEALDRLTAGRTTFMITHRLAHAAQVDSIVMLEGGTIVEHGQPQELVASGRLQARLGELQRRQDEAGLAAVTTGAATGPASAPVVATTLASKATAEGGGQGRIKRTFAFMRRSTLFGGIAGALAGLLLFVLVTGAGADAAVPAAPAVSTLTATSFPVPTVGAILTDPTGIGFGGALTAVSEGAPVLSRAMITGTVQDGRPAQVYSGALASAVVLAWSPDNRTIALGAANKSVYLLDTISGAVKAMTGHTAPVYTLAWSPDGAQLATTGPDETVRLWQNDGTAIGMLGGLAGTGAGLGWLDGGKTLARASTSLQIDRWRAGAAPDSGQAATYLLNSVVWSPNGKLLAASANDNQVRLWGQDGTALATLAGHSGEVYGLDWSPDSKILASASNDTTVRLWSADGAPLATLAGHSGLVNGVSWAPDGTIVASASKDGTIRLWSAGGAALATLRTDGTEALWVDWSPDGSKLAGLTASGAVWIWPVGSRGG